MAFAGELPPGIINPTAYRNLPKAEASQEIVEAVLLEYDMNGKEEKPLWFFLVNPRALQFQDQAEYGTVSPLATKAKHRFYNAASGATLRISDLVFSLYCLGRSARPLIDGARALLRAKPEENKFAPPVLMFRMGRRRFGPCILTSVDWSEEAWLGGDPARVKMSLVLEEIARPLTPAELEAKAKAKEQAERDKNKAEDKPKLPLTQRQREEASKAAKEYLTKNAEEWDANVQSLVKRGAYKLSTDEKTGDVTMFDSKGQKLGTVLRALGDKKLLANKTITTIPLKTGGKVPELKPS